MTSTLASDLTDDAFLGGRLQILQPRKGYRAGVDPVLLAASIPAKPGQSVLDLGTGVGTALLCLSARVPDLHLTGVELQPDYADLACQNLTRNAANGAIHTADLRALPPTITAQRFDHVFANPPYLDRTQGTAARNDGRDTAFAGDTPLAHWITTAARRVAPKGTLTLIQRADRLPDMLAALPQSMGSPAVLPLTGRTGRAADRVILQTRHSGGAPFRLLAPLILHAGETHGSDSPDYTPIVDSVLRNAAELTLSS